MQWQDTGVILSVYKHGENAAVVKIFTPSRGVHAGLCRINRKSRGLYQPGNIVDIIWKARLEEHLGNFTLELKHAIVGIILHDGHKLTGLQSACTMIEQTLAERDPHPELYFTFEHFLHTLSNSTLNTWFSHYILFELELLRQLGFGLDLERCVATGKTEELDYISPKSGCAVSQQAGAPYKEKLLPFPMFLQKKHHNGDIKSIDIQNGLTLTEYFLNKFMFEPLNKSIPAARMRLKDALS